MAFGNGTSQAFTYDSASRLASLTNNLDGAATTNDLSLSFSYNPAGQIKTATRSNDAYAWTHHVNVDRPYVASAGATSFGYDARGNLNLSGSQAYGYSNENLMVTGPDGFTASYDPLGRLKSTSSTTAPLRNFAYDGMDLITELDVSSLVQHRYVHGPGTDNPIIWYNGSLINNTTRRFLMADERGSIISVADSSGSTIHINSYDEYGIPAPGNTGRFGYTGQTWLPEIGMWYFKARIYSPTLGRFLQTDPIGYEDGLNWYNYAGSDPFNNVDPFGLFTNIVDNTPINVIGTRPQNTIGGAWFPVPMIPAYSVSDRLRDMNPGTGKDDTIIVTAEKENWIDCALAIGKAGSDGFVDPLAFAYGYGKATYEARNRVGPEDYGKPENRWTFKRSAGSSLRIGLKRFIPGYIQASLISGGLRSIFEAIENPSCGISGN